MMYEKDSDDGQVEMTAPPIDDDVLPAPSRWARLHDALPVALLMIGVVAIVVGLHGAGGVVIGAAVIHVVVALAMLLVSWIRLRRAQ